MSYLVLARKWRPKKFAELVGQTHVVKALTNALETGRVHHAFLFTGTRGVGKTTIARIFAKSLNCEQGTGSEPCGECSTCRDIDAGRYFDLVEIDAASNTGVDDVRELIESAQYVPSRGKFKVFLIDEVHMLSKSAFNALLKTLEEPPEHVKFLLATTDPQKLPVTVLSRCLQFNLMRLDEEQIRGQIRHILEQEGISAQDQAVALIAKGADGSLRDALSLLDQAIAFTGSNLLTDQVERMLGTVDRTRIAQLLGALAAGDGARLMQEIQALSEFSPDWIAVLDALNEAFHRIQIAQLVSDAGVPSDDLPLAQLAATTQPELVQLWYQMALNARRDLGYAPSPRVGFEMALLRMLAFKPGVPTAVVGSSIAAVSPIQTPPPVAIAKDPDSEISTGAPTTSAPAADPVAPLGSAADWVAAVKIMPATGVVKHFAEMLHWVSCDGDELHFELEEQHQYLKDEQSLRALGKALAAVGYPDIKIQVRSAKQATQSNSVQVTREREAQRVQSQAEQDFVNDPDIAHLLAQPDTELVKGSIKPH